MRRVLVGAGLPVACLIALAAAACAQTRTPVTGHYPPGQSGIRGAAASSPGLTITNFNRFFSNLNVHDAHGDGAGEVGEVRYANITMITWTTSLEFIGMTYGALAGIPFSTGNLRPSGEDLDDTSLGLGDILVTPVSLYGTHGAFDHQFQFTVWSASGRFSPGATNNRGSGFWALVYSVGGVYYPGSQRDAWSVSAIARLEQNFEQEGTGITPGDDVVVDWGIGRVVRVGSRPLDIGIAGFGTWQLSTQAGGPPDVDVSRYRYQGIGVDASYAASSKLAIRMRIQWEYAARNVVEGNNVWVILNYRIF